MDLMEKARNRMIVEHPFYACLLFRQALRPVTWGTMATDGTAIYYNPEWVAQRTIAEVVGVLAHECMHTANLHHTRRGNRDAELWNIACDYAINSPLIEQGFTLPEGALYKKEYSGWSAENIYADLLKQQQQDQQQDDPQDGSEGNTEDSQGDSQGDQGQDTGSDDDGSGAQGEGSDDGSGSQGSGDDFGVPWGQVLDATNDVGQPLTQAEIEQVESDIQAVVHQAAIAEVKRVGREGAGHVRGITDGYKVEQQPWHQILAEALTDCVQYDETYNNIDRRMVYHGLNLPDYDTLPNGELVFAIDTSGSLSEDDLAEIAQHSRDIVDLINPTRVVVIYCDATVNHVDEFERGDELVFSMHGGGGTEFNPPFNYVEREGIHPHALIYFTDGCGFVGDTGLTWHGEPDYPVFWCTTFQAPYFQGIEAFGDVIKLAA